MSCPTGSWLLDVTGQPLSLAAFYQVRRFRLPGCPRTFWFAKDAAILAQLLAQRVDPGQVWLEAELLAVLLAVDTEAQLAQVIAVKLALDGVVTRAVTDGLTIPRSKPKLTVGRSRRARRQEAGDK
jgi:hypothetical protein